MRPNNDWEIFVIQLDYIIETKTKYYYNKIIHFQTLF